MLSLKVFHCWHPLTFYGLFPYESLIERISAQWRTEEASSGYQCYQRRQDYSLRQRQPMQAAALREILVIYSLITADITPVLEPRQSRDKA